MESGRYYYELDMTTPLGKRRGAMELIVEGDFLNGYLTMFTRTIPFRKAWLHNGKLHLEGEMKTLMNMIPYRAEGTVTPSGVTMTIAAPQGNYPVRGRLTEVKRR